MSNTDFRYCAVSALWVSPDFASVAEAEAAVKAHPGDGFFAVVGYATGNHDARHEVVAKARRLVRAAAQAKRDRDLSAPAAVEEALAADGWTLN